MHTREGSGTRGARRRLALSAGAALLALSATAGAQDQPPDDEAVRARLAEIERQQKELDAERRQLLEQIGEAVDELTDSLPESDGAQIPDGPWDTSPAVSDAIPPLDDDDIVIVARRYGQPTNRVVPTVTVMTRKDLERRQSPLLAEVLAESPGFLLGPTGPAGGFSAPFVRGASANQTLVLINGIPMNNAADSGGFNFQGVTTTAIERVEILRGSYGLLYGSEAVGGIVAIETQRGRGPAEGFLLMEGGKFGMHREAIGVRGASGITDYAFSMTNYRTKTDQKHQDSRTVDAVGRFGLQINRDVRLDTTAYFQDTEAEFALELDKARAGLPIPEEPNGQNNLQRFAIGWELTANVTDWLTGRLHLSVLETEQSEDDGPNNATTFDPDGTPDSGDEFEAFLDEFHGMRQETDMRARLMLTNDLNEAFGWARSDEGGVDVAFIVGAELVNQDTDELQVFPDQGNTEAPQYSAQSLNADNDITSFFALADIGLPDMGPIAYPTINAGIRTDNHSEFDSEESPFFGVRFDTPATDTTWRASYGEGYFAPKATSLNDPFFGNPDLEPVKSENVDLGATQRFFDGALEVGATWYDMKLVDLVIFDRRNPTPDRPFGQLKNTGGARARGWEYTLAADLGMGFKLRGSATSQNPRIERDSRQYGTKHFGYAGISWEDARWLVSLDGTFIGSQGLSRDSNPPTGPDPDERENPGRVKLVNLTARYRATDSLTFFARVENLLDEDYIPRILSTHGLPLGVYGGFQLDF